MVDGIPNRPLYFYQKDMIDLHLFTIPFDIPLIIIKVPFMETTLYVLSLTSVVPSARNLLSKQPGPEVVPSIESERDPQPLSQPKR